MRCLTARQYWFLIVVMLTSGATNVLGCREIDRLGAVCREYRAENDRLRAGRRDRDWADRMNEQVGWPAK